MPQGSAPGPGLADHYIGAIAALARRFVNESTVAGIEIINEPLPGFKFLIDPPIQAREFLYALYKRVIQAITGVRDGLPDCLPNVALPSSSNPSCAYQDLGIHDTRHIFFFEPAAERNTFDTTFDFMGIWTNYTNIVFTPHVYTYVFTLHIPNFPPNFAYAYETALTEANAMKAPVFVTEYGAGANEDDTLVTPTLDQAELYQIGGTLWSWKSNCGDGVCPWAWTMFAPAVGNGSVAPNGALWPARERLMSRIHSRGSPGEVLTSLYNVTTRTFVFAANLTHASWLKLVHDREIAAAQPTAAWSVKENFPVHRYITALNYTPALLPSYTANGTVLEIYLPRSISATPVALLNCKLLGITHWPDASRSAFFSPSGVGVFSMGVAGTAGVGNPDSSLLTLLKTALLGQPTKSTLLLSESRNKEIGESARVEYEEKIAKGLLFAAAKSLLLPPGLSNEDDSVQHLLSRAKEIIDIKT